MSSLTAAARQRFRCAWHPVPSMQTSSPRTADPQARCQRCAARQSCVIGRLPSGTQERLDPLIREKPFRKGELLQTEGSVPATVRTVKLGTVMLTRQGPDQHPHPVALAGRGFLMGLWGLLDGGTLLGAEALSSGRVCELPANTLRQLLEQGPTLQTLLHEQMARDVALLADWAQLMRLRGLPSQLVAALILLSREQGASRIQLPSQVALAHLLGASRESVARALRLIEQRGYLQRTDRWHGELTSTHRHIFHGDGEAPEPGKA